MTQLQLWIDPEQIRSAVVKTALQIDQLYQGKEITLVLVMKGAICLAADLMRALQTPCCIAFVQASSYGERGIQPGALQLAGFENLDCTGKHVIVIDDIFDSGETLTAVVQKIQSSQPESLKSLVLLKKKRQRKGAYLPDFSLFEIEDQFVVGYGLDYKEHYRGLPGIYQFNPE